MNHERDKVIKVDFKLSVKRMEIANLHIWVLSSAAAAQFNEDTLKYLTLLGTQKAYLPKKFCFDVLNTACTDCKRR